MSEIDKRINEDLIPKAVNTLEILMDDNDSKIQLQAAKEVLDGTLFKKSNAGNTLVFNVTPNPLTEDEKILIKDLQNEDVSVQTFEEVGEE